MMTIQYCRDPAVPFIPNLFPSPFSPRFRLYIRLSLHLVVILHTYFFSLSHPHNDGRLAIGSRCKAVVQCIRSSRIYYVKSVGG